jgi:hypothetical protein
MAGGFEDSSIALLCTATPAGRSDLSVGRKSVAYERLANQSQHAFRCFCVEIGNDVLECGDCLLNRSNLY